MRYMTFELHLLKEDNTKQKICRADYTDIDLQQMLSNLRVGDKVNYRDEPTSQGNYKEIVIEKKTVVIRKVEFHRTPHNYHFNQLVKILIK